ncbi:Heat shock protein [Citrus sinensis]|nr:Heat shock protein [Citrus sinensis]
MRKWWRTKCALGQILRLRGRGFRSDAALKAISIAGEERVKNLALYNYPSLSGSLSALFAHLFHSHLNLPCLLLPFSSVEPLRVEDLCIEGLERVYLLDFLGPKRFADALSRGSSCEVIGFDHRKSVLGQITSDHPDKVTFYVDLEKSSSTAAYEYFSSKLVDLNSPDLLEINSVDLIAKGNSDISSRQSAANKFLDKVFRVRLGRGFYGECLGVRADGNSYLSDEIGKQLSARSAAAGLRPIGAVIYMQRNNLKMCLRSTDSATDTSEIAKAYGGGGSASSSSFIIRMDEYNQWLSVNASRWSKGMMHHFVKY